MPMSDCGSQNSKNSNDSGRGGGGGVARDHILTTSNGTTATAATGASVCQSQVLQSQGIYPHENLYYDVSSICTFVP